MKTVLLVFVILLPSPGFCQEQAETFSITGTVLNAEGKPIINSVVVPLSEFGAPLNRSDLKPATMMSVEQAGGKDFVVFTQTNEQGEFSFELPAGKYRIIAQSWLAKAKITDLLEENGSRLRIDGFLEVEFANEMEAAESFEIRPVGTAQLTVSSQEESDLLLISSEPLACDVVLGFVSMMGDFWSGLLAGTAMEKKEIVISGLPAGDIQVVSFVNDNNGGFGASKTTLGEGEVKELYVGVIAGWSNGHRTPPEDLEDLTEYFHEHPAEAARTNEVMNELRKQVESEGVQRFEVMLELSRRLLTRLDEEFELSNGEKTTLGDAMAAAGYARLKKK